LTEQLGRGYDEAVISEHYSAWRDNQQEPQMNLDFTPEDQAFRKEVRTFVETQLPAATRERVLNGMPLERDDVVRWHKLLHSKGWAGFNWPKEFGGTGWTPVQVHIFDVECAAAGAPRILPFGVNMVAPVIMAFGSPAQQKRFLPRILSFDDWWCQGYSEPGSGSDLASLKTKAERKGDHYLVNGQKTWTTLAQYADWIFCLVRTSSEGRSQEGISFLLIDMKSPGVSVRPIVMLDGEHEINEVWFEDVKVPVENRVGEENKGWTYAKYLLGHERIGIAEVGRNKRELARLKQVARTQKSRGKPLIEDARFRDRIADVELSLMALEITAMRVLTAPAREKAPRPESSLLKIRGSQIRQDISELMMLAAGPDALAEKPDRRFTAQYLNDRKTSIYGGSNEIQKNIVAQMILGL
jgi:alkylation response protein AidB-like acyl-CoA dehydrogenase